MSSLPLFSSLFLFSFLSFSFITFLLILHRDLSGNLISGSILECLSQLSNLEYLYVTSHLFSPLISSSLHFLFFRGDREREREGGGEGGEGGEEGEDVIKFIIRYLRDNKLNGTVPIVKLPNLQTLYLSFLLLFFSPLFLPSSLFCSYIIVYNIYIYFEIK